MYLGQGELEGAWMSLAKINLPEGVCCFWVHNAATGLAHLVSKDERCVLERIDGRSKHGGRQRGY